MLIDSSVLIAYLNKDDSLHQEAKQLIRQLKKDREVIDILDTVYEEVLAVLRKRHSKLIAINAAGKIMASSAVRIICINKETLLKSSRMFIKHQGRYSYVDCSLAEWAEKHNIKTIIAIDRHFSELGLTVIP